MTRKPVRNVSFLCVEMIKNNIDQWDESYPNSEVISEYKGSKFYVNGVDNKIIGGVNIDQLQEHAYLDINWKDKSGHFLSSLSIRNL